MRVTIKAMNGDPGPSTTSHRPARLTVEFVHRSDSWDGAGLDEAALAAAAQAAWTAAGGETGGDVAVVLTDDAEIRALNRSWAGKDRATDVLSFPGDEEGEASEERSLGDIVLAFGTVERDAVGSGLSLTAHACHLVVHGMLHLLGYVHSTDAQAVEMERLETEILARLGLHDPYGVRARQLASAK
jgi:probable rRNA maturation factor